MTITPPPDTEEKLRKRAARTTTGTSGATAIPLCVAHSLCSSPKNRFGPAVLKPVPLLMNPKTTELRISPHQRSVSSVAGTFLGLGQGIGEIQASVSLPSYGTRGRITAPNLPRKEIEQLTSCISGLDDMELGDLDLPYSCASPVSDKEICRSPNAINERQELLSLTGADTS